MSLSTKPFFLGIDSDGCAIDSMEFKHRHCFAPATVAVWGLEPVAEAALECALFVNLYSQSRGKNRFPALLETLDKLRSHPAVKAAGFAVPEASGLRAWLADEANPSVPTLETARTANPGDDLERTLRWNQAVNERIAEKADALAAFPGVAEALGAAREQAYISVLSSANTAAVEREWEDNGLLQYVEAVAAQETGSKTTHLQRAAAEGFDNTQRLVVGDAPGDLTAARATRSLFFPIIPGEETASWERFIREGLPRWFNGRFNPAYQDSLIVDFEHALPDSPPWLHES